MPYHYLDDIATADIAFEAWGKSVGEMFVSAADATMNVMVENLDAIAADEEKILFVEDDAIDLVLFQFLQELVYFKDAESLLLRVKDLDIQSMGKKFSCSAKAYGEKINPDKHMLNVDVKAITFHRFEVKQSERGWEVTVVLDI